MGTGVQSPMPKPGCRVWRRLAAGAGVLLLAACATVRPPPQQPPVVEVPATPVAPLRPPPPAAQPALPPAAPAPIAPAPAAPQTAQPVPAAAADRRIMLIESDPAGAVIVVDGRPVGRAPVRLDVPVTSQGFFRDDLEVRARFVARDETEVSRTATEEFNPRQRVPAVVRFTPGGVQRSMTAPSPGSAGAASPDSASR